MEILGLIPARSGSKGIEGKNIKSLGGRLLIEYTFSAARGSRRLTRTVLSTDGPDIAALGERHGIEVPFIRPAEISGDQSPAVDYVRHCLDCLHDSQAYRPDILVILQPTTPFRTAADIDASVDMLIESNADSVVSVSLLPDKYHPRWQFAIGDDGLLNPYEGGRWDGIPAQRQGITPTYTRNGAVYAFWSKTFLVSGTIYGSRIIPYVMPDNRSVNIDDADDWQKAESLLVAASRANGF